MVHIPKITTGPEDDDFYDKHSPEQVEEIARQDAEFTRSLLAEGASVVEANTISSNARQHVSHLLDGLAAGATTLDEWKQVELRKNESQAA